MKTSLKANLLKHLIAKKEEGGFTLIELLVVIIIIGILAAIALPSFLNQANKAKQSEAKTYIGSINRAQQAHFLEKNGYTSDISDLGLGIRSQTENYKYDLSTIAGTSNKNAWASAFPWLDDAGTEKYDGGSTLSSYLGLQGIGQTSEEANDTSSELTTLAVLCESEKTPAQGGAGTGTTQAIGAVTDAPVKGSNTTFATFDKDAGPTCEGDGTAGFEQIGG